jgi:IS5 family transposase
MSWDNFNESGDLKAQVEADHSFTGHYPESVHADRIYRTRENRAWCKEKGIRIGGPPLGRPPANVSKEKKKQALEDERIRNAICQKVWGLCKRRFSLARIMAKLDNTSQTAIAITFLVMNLSTWWRRVFCVFLCRAWKTMPIFGSHIICVYKLLRLRQEKIIFIVISNKNETLSCKISANNLIKRCGRMRIHYSSL